MVISVGIPTYAGMKTGFQADVSSLETGFHASIGQNAGTNNLKKPTSNAGF